ncbi:MAG: hypothetical protein ACI9S8_003328 [Chlamydiales bacterium]|jgi:hypothetical protein
MRLFQAISILSDNYLYDCRVWFRGFGQMFEVEHVGNNGEEPADVAKRKGWKILGHIADGSVVVRRGDKACSIEFRGYGENREKKASIKALKETFFIGAPGDSVEKAIQREKYSIIKHLYPPEVESHILIVCDQYQRKLKVTWGVSDEKVSAKVIGWMDKQ